MTREDAERFIKQYLHSAQWEGESLMITFEQEALIAALIGDVEPPQENGGLRDAATAALKILTGSGQEYALVDFPARPNYTICDQLREALGLPAQDRSDWT